MLIKVIFVVTVICLTQIESQESARGDQSIISPNFDYEDYSYLDKAPTRGDLGSSAIKLHTKTRKKRSTRPLRGDQGPPPDYDYYSNYIDEGPSRGDLGLSTVHLHGNRVLGSTTDITLFPYQVSLTQYNNFTEQWEHICGGSIINSNIVVTAAHCTLRITSQIYGTTRVRVGSSSILSGGELIRIKTIINHERYNARTANNDIALIVLARKITFSDKVNKISLASRCRPAGNIATISGWGYLNESARIPSPNLNYMKFVIVDLAKCQKAYREERILTNSMICAGYSSGQWSSDTYASCPTDVGGPLVEGSELIGIVSLCGGRGRPSIFADVYHLRNWINRVFYSYSL